MRSLQRKYPFHIILLSRKKKFFDIIQMNTLADANQTIEEAAEVEQGGANKTDK